MTALVIGGGLAGLAAAAQLALRGFRVTILESRNRLGGRAGSFMDAASGQLIDACQHVSMGCCTEFQRFCKLTGIEHLLAPQKILYFMTPDRRVSRFRADDLPAPLHLGRAFTSAHFLTPCEKLRIGYGLWRLMRESIDADPPLREWLFQHRQTDRTIERFWGLVLVSALNESIDRIGLKYARKVFADAFLGDRRGFELSIPTVPLDRLYGDELQSWFRQHRVEIRLNQAATKLAIDDGIARGVQLRSGEAIASDVIVSAVPFDRLLSLTPPELVERESYFGNLKRHETSPISSVHLWWDRPIMKLPHVVVIDCLSQWVFNRGGNYVQVVVSAARLTRQLGGEEIQRRVIEELRQLLPAAQSAQILRSRVVTEHAATFSAVPGVDRWRPGPVSPIKNLFVAGDWTATGWPATMEGAVRSGFAAAAAACGSATVPPAMT